VAGVSLRPCGDYRTSYRADTTIFPTRAALLANLLGIALICLAPLGLDAYYLNLLIQIGYYGIAALGLNILVGFSGQISLGHSAFFGLWRQSP
jgi:branched-chain amino acid transport system permease protein